MHICVCVYIYIYICHCFLKCVSNLAALPTCPTRNQVVMSATGKLKWEIPYGPGNSTP